jgi:hypothetical protein
MFWVLCMSSCLTSILHQSYVCCNLVISQVCFNIILTSVTWFSNCVVSVHVSTKIMFVSGFPYTCYIPSPSWNPSYNFSGIGKAPRRSHCMGGGGVAKGGPQTYRMLKLVGSFGLGSICLTEGSILRDLGASSLIITGGPDWLSVSLVIVAAHKYDNRIGNVSK